MIIEKHWRDIYDFISWQQFSCFPAKADSSEPIPGLWFWFLHYNQMVVCIYELDEKIAFSECSILRFDEPGEPWLDFVSDNRSGNYEGKSYDFIFGPVANDDVSNICPLHCRCVDKGTGVGSA